MSSKRSLYIKQQLLKFSLQLKNKRQQGKQTTTEQTATPSEADTTTVQLSMMETQTTTVYQTTTLKILTTTAEQMTKGKKLRQTDHYSTEADATTVQLTNDNREQTTTEQTLLPQRQIQQRSNYRASTEAPTTTVDQTTTQDSRHNCRTKRQQGNKLQQNQTTAPYRGGYNNGSTVNVDGGSNYHCRSNSNLQILTATAEQMTTGGTNYDRTNHCSTEADTTTVQLSTSMELQLPLGRYNNQFNCQLRLETPTTTVDQNNKLLKFSLQTAEQTTTGEQTTTEQTTTPQRQIQQRFNCQRLTGNSTTTVDQTTTSEILTTTAEQMTI
ncbi:unnamed protein product [Mytilus edulis]|uniref:Uncharacterized protein n=1 Tax=Mytilus edulis TaxID=6550 RepID=A0A8S3PS92_MYTED|nr:unnamed protein product [Mytilus edulis]